MLCVFLQIYRLDKCKSKEKIQKDSTTFTVWLLQGKLVLDRGDQGEMQLLFSWLEFLFLSQKELSCIICKCSVLSVPHPRMPFSPQKYVKRLKCNFGCVSFFLHFHQCLCNVFYAVRCIKTHFYIFFTNLFSSYKISLFHFIFLPRILFCLMLILLFLHFLFEFPCSIFLYLYCLIETPVWSCVCV